jgi:2-polyprenyl-3-methyl-5-hydroxy-6-metoxy-1,4-benzoquinol methylase
MADATAHDWQAQQGRMRQLTAYYGWTASNMRPHFRPGRLLDAGCGAGSLLQQIAGEFTEVVGVDYAPSNVEQARAALAAFPHVQILQFDLAQPSFEALGLNSFDTVVSADVIEHIRDDDRFAANIAAILKPGGRVIIKTPAHPSLYGSIDEASEHYRRYTRAMMRERLERAGLVVRDIRYMNMLGAVLYFYRCRIQKHRSEFSATVGKQRNFTLLNQIVPLLRTIERAVPPPFGLSVVAAAEKRS